MMTPPFNQQAGGRGRPPLNPVAPDEQQPPYPGSFWGKITGALPGAVTQYSFTEIDEGDLVAPFDAELSDGFAVSGAAGDAPAFEVNNNPFVPAGTRVRIWPGGDLTYYLFEFDAAGSGSASGSVPCSGPVLTQSVLCIGGTQYVTTGQLDLATGDWCTLETVESGCCSCPASGSGSGSGVPCGGGAQPVAVLASGARLVSCGEQLLTGTVAFVGDSTWEGALTGGGLSAVAQLKLLGNGSFTWAALVTRDDGSLMGLSGTLTTAGGGTLLEGSASVAGFSGCTITSAPTQVQFGNPCAGSGSGSGGSGSGGVSTCGCTGVPATLYAHVTDAGGCSCLAGTYALVYNAGGAWIDVTSSACSHLISIALTCTGAAWALNIGCPAGGTPAASASFTCPPAFSVTFAGVVPDQISGPTGCCTGTVNVVVNTSP